ncbi:MAG: cyclic nucleotide-binding domain-containing protein [Pseudomonadota bacterium]
MKQGQWLWRSGDQATHVAIIVQGQLNLIRRHEGEKELHIASLRDGDMVGQFEVLSETRIFSNIKANQDTILFIIPATNFIKTEKQDPQLARNIIREFGLLMTRTDPT